MPLAPARRPGPLIVLLAVGLLAACGPFAGKEDAGGEAKTEEHAEGADADDGADGAEEHDSEDHAEEAPEVEARADHEAASTSAAHGGGPAHWGYSGKEGPEHWGELSADYELCASGEQQSPVNIARGTPGALEDLVFAYHPSATQVVDNGHTIQVNIADGGTLTLDGERYELAQFHFHAPSEHEMGGANYPMEVHLVHRSAAGELAVVGAFVHKGEALDAMGPIFDHLPGAGQTVDGPAAFDATALLPDYRGTIRYAGSLTTPPCSEGVHWNVLVAPIQLSPEQIKTFTSRHPHSNRPVQSLGERALTIDLTVAE